MLLDAKSVQEYNRAKRTITEHQAEMEELMKPQQEEKCTLNFIRRNIVGNEAVMRGPFGLKKIVYCDYVASGKPLRCIEEYIERCVYPYYANTHTTTSFSARQTTSFREDARHIIKSCLNCRHDDVLVFCGNGATGAVHKLIHAMRVRDHAATTVVITGPHEHHSNILPWKETGCTTEEIGCNANGLVDLVALKSKLQQHSQKENCSLIVSMSAASNVTGIMTDTEAVARLCHQYNALSIWDYAAGAPYLEVDMNPSTGGCKDAVFISPHKFVGGVGSPGILVAKRHLFVNEVPHGCGGGTVNWVTRESHEYLNDIEEREEGGTPAIIGSIRAGLAFQIKRAVGQDIISEREDYLCQRAIKRWSGNENLIILGNLTANRLPIISFLVLHKESELYLHHNFVSTLLNDLYGVQSRGGCMCAGPYAQHLLNINPDMASRFTKLLSPQTGKEPRQVMKPGFCRVNLPYFASEETIEYVLEAIDQVATYGWMLLPLYTFNTASGEWNFVVKDAQTKVRSLQEIVYSREGMLVRDSNLPVHFEGDVDYSDMLEDARVTIRQAHKLSAMVNFSEENQSTLTLSKEEQTLRWFLEPKQAQHFLQKDSITGTESLNEDVSVIKQLGEMHEETKKEFTQQRSNVRSISQVSVPAWQNRLLGQNYHQRQQFQFQDKKMFLPNENKFGTSKSFPDVLVGHVQKAHTKSNQPSSFNKRTEMKEPKRKKGQTTHNKDCVIL